MAEKYGGWDAWCFWNLHAKYMAGGIDTWQNIFLNTFAVHSDYPLMMPGINGFVMQLLGQKSYALFPFLLAFSTTVFIPSLIYFETIRKNLLVALVTLLLFALSRSYLGNCVSQYADTILGFFFLCAVVCVKYGSETPRYIALTTACLGCCMWTKNEGVVLSAVFVIFNLRTLFSRKNFMYAVMGVALPLVALAIFKIRYAPQNDLVGGLNASVFHQLLEGSRYKQILSHFADEIKNNFTSVGIAFGLYLALCAFEKKLPDAQFVMLTCCLCAYIMIYVLSNQELGWHLATSQERLIHQVMPAMVYVISQRFAHFISARFPSRQPSFQD
jgi:hypothetical protein